MPAISSWASAKLMRVDQVGGRPEPPVHELGDRTHLRAVVERHHHDAEEQHRGHGADPEVVHGRDAVVRAVRGHADDLDGAQVRGDEGETRDPCGQRAAGQEEVDAARHRPLGQDADAEHEDEVQRDQQVVDPVRVEPELGIRRENHRSSMSERTVLQLPGCAQAMRTPVNRVRRRDGADRSAPVTAPATDAGSDGGKVDDELAGDRRRRLHRRPRGAGVRGPRPAGGGPRRPVERAPRVRARRTSPFVEGSILDTELLGHDPARARGRGRRARRRASSTPASPSSARCTPTSRTSPAR